MKAIYGDNLATPVPVQLKDEEKKLKQAIRGISAIASGFREIVTKIKEKDKEGYLGKRIYEIEERLHSIEIGLKDAGTRPLTSQLIYDLQSKLETIKKDIASLQDVVQLLPGKEEKTPKKTIIPILFELEQAARKSPEEFAKVLVKFEKALAELDDEQKKLFINFVYSTEGAFSLQVLLRLAEDSARQDGTEIGSVGYNKNVLEKLVEIATAINAAAKQRVAAGDSVSIYSITLAVERADMAISQAFYNGEMRGPTFSIGPSTGGAPAGALAGYQSAIETLGKLTALIEGKQSKYLKQIIAGHLMEFLKTRHLLSPEAFSEELMQPGKDAERKAHTEKHSMYGLFKEYMQRFVGEELTAVNFLEHFENFIRDFNKMYIRADRLNGINNMLNKEGFTINLFALYNSISERFGEEHFLNVMHHLYDYSDDNLDKLLMALIKEKKGEALNEKEQELVTLYFEKLIPLLATGIAPRMISAGVSPAKIEQLLANVSFTDVQVVITAWLDALSAGYNSPLLNTIVDRMIEVSAKNPRLLKWFMADVYLPIVNHSFDDKTIGDALETFRAQFTGRFAGLGRTDITNYEYYLIRTIFHDIRARIESARVGFKNYDLLGNITPETPGTPIEMVWHRVTHTPLDATLRRFGEAFAPPFRQPGELSILAGYQWLTIADTPEHGIVGIFNIQLNADRIRKILEKNLVPSKFIDAINVPPIASASYQAWDLIPAIIAAFQNVPERFSDLWLYYSALGGLAFTVAGKQIQPGGEKVEGSQEIAGGGGGIFATGVTPTGGGEARITISGAQNATNDSLYYLAHLDAAATTVKLAGLKTRAASIVADITGTDEIVQTARQRMEANMRDVIGEHDMIVIERFNYDRDLDNRDLEPDFLDRVESAKTYIVFIGKNGERVELNWDHIKDNDWFQALSARIDQAWADYYNTGRYEYGTGNQGAAIAVELPDAFGKTLTDASAASVSRALEKVFPGDKYINWEYGTGLGYRINEKWAVGIFDTGLKHIDENKWRTAVSALAYYFDRDAIARFGAGTGAIAKLFKNAEPMAAFFATGYYHGRKFFNHLMELSANMTFDQKVAYLLDPEKEHRLVANVNAAVDLLVGHQIDKETRYILKLALLHAVIQQFMQVTGPDGKMKDQEIANKTAKALYLFFGYKNVAGLGGSGIVRFMFGPPEMELLALFNRWQERNLTDRSALISGYKNLLNRMTDVIKLQAEYGKDKRLYLNVFAGNFEQAISQTSTGQPIESAEQFRAAGEIIAYITDKFYLGGAVRYSQMNFIQRETTPLGDLLEEENIENSEKVQILDTIVTAGVDGKIRVDLGATWSDQANLGAGKLAGVIGRIMLGWEDSILSIAGSHADLKQLESTRGEIVYSVLVDGQPFYISVNYVNRKIKVLETKPKEHIIDLTTSFVFNRTEEGKWEAVIDLFSYLNRLKEMPGAQLGAIWSGITTRFGAFVGWHVPPGVRPGIPDTYNFISGRPYDFLIRLFIMHSWGVLE